MRTAPRTILAAIAVPPLVLAAGPLAQADAPRHLGERGTHAAATDATNAFTYDTSLVPVGARVKVDACYLPDGRSVVVLRASGLVAEREYGAHAHILDVLARCIPPVLVLGGGVRDCAVAPCGPEAMVGRPGCGHRTADQHRPCTDPVVVAAP